MNKFFKYNHSDTIESPLLIWFYRWCQCEDKLTGSSLNPTLLDSTQNTMSQSTDQYLVPIRLRQIWYKHRLIWPISCHFYIYIFDLVQTETLARKVASSEILKCPSWLFLFCSFICSLSPGCCTSSIPGIIQNKSPSWEGLFWVNRRSVSRQTRSMEEHRDHCLKRVVHCTGSSNGIIIEKDINMCPHCFTIKTNRTWDVSERLMGQSLGLLLHF